MLCLAIGGCSTTAGTVVHETLTDVNRSLRNVADTELQITYLFSSKTSAAYWVEITSDSLFYSTADKAGARRVGIAVSTVKEVYSPARSGSAAGALVGAAPGMLFLGHLALNKPDCPEPNTSFCGIGWAYGVVLSFPAIIVGSVAGLIIGKGATKRPRITYYRRPVSKYLE